MIIFHFRLDPSMQAVYFFIKKLTLVLKHKCIYLFTSNTEIKGAGWSCLFFYTTFISLKRRALYEYTAKYSNNIAKIYCFFIK